VVSTSTTVTAKDPVAVLPRLSAVEQDTIVTPTAKTVPEAGAQVAATLPSTRSDPEAVYVATAPAGLEVSIVGPLGRDSAGGVVSVTVTVKVALADSEVPSSVAVHVTVVEPSGNVDPDAGEHAPSLTLPDAFVTVGGGYETNAPSGPVASTV
jgi:hypothetical protein